MKFKYVVIVLSLVSVLILYSVSTLSQPTVISLSAVPLNEGKQVMVNGVVTTYQTTTFGSQLITIRDGNDTTLSSITLYIEGEITVEYGDRVQATGIVQQYNNNWELSISNPRFVVVLEHWGNRSCPVWQLALNPAKYIDTNVNVTGVVDAPSGKGFMLCDPEGSCTVPVSYTHSSKSSLLKNDMVAVKARFLYDQKTLSYQLTVTNATQDIVILESNHV
jgi:hypothetical protein